MFAGSTNYELVDMSGKIVLVGNNLVGVLI